MLEKTEEVRVATLLPVIGSDALQAYNTFQWQTDEHVSVQAVLGKFECYCTPKKNTSYERFVFMNRKQKKDESIEDYAVALR